MEQLQERIFCEASQSMAGALLGNEVIVSYFKITYDSKRSSSASFSSVYSSTPYVGANIHSGEPDCDVNTG